MRCGKPANVSMILIGLHEVGLLGLSEAFEEVETLELQDRDAIVDHVVARLAGQNYIPESQQENYRRGIWREYLRRRGEDFSDFYSEVEVTVRGAAGSVRDRFVATLISVFGDFELKPVVTFVQTGSAEPELLVDGETVLQGEVTREAAKAAVRKRIREW
ncbi:MAG: hypothetical protein JSW67_11165 [Candidatus Latescibacterota bacterium]|nr:MAG: hypothetical protein JSW67_11165 [Candidatus Latescibacterota bacterium]